ncbi:MAG TPA: GYF domain-containing protein [Kofleriaceae bacterium]|nr:GYF domain-containing protein [Kofleriaceae bacterium]
MKFLCDRCKTRYSIGDDRVRGKILKIRCKHCSNVITVREGMAVDDGSVVGPLPSQPGQSGQSGQPGRSQKSTLAPEALDERAASGLLRIGAPGKDGPSTVPLRPRPAGGPGGAGGDDAGKLAGSGPAPAPGLPNVTRPGAAGFGGGLSPKTNAGLSAGMLRAPGAAGRGPATEPAKRLSSLARGGPASAAGAVPGAALPKPPPALEEEWYVSIDGDQSGPFSLVDAQRWVAQKPFDADLHCWSEGFDDWLSVDKVSHFRGLRKRPAPPSAPSSAPPALPPRATPPRPALGGPRAAAAAAPKPSARPEDEPKPLFAATMASLERGAQPASNPGLQLPPARAHATPPFGTAMPPRTNGAAAAPHQPAGAAFDPDGPDDPDGLDGLDAQTQLSSPLLHLGSDPVSAPAHPPHPARPGSSDASLTRQHMPAMTNPPDSGPMAMARPAAAAGAALPSTPSELGVAVGADLRGGGDGDDLDIGEVSRVVNLADLARSARATPQPARRAGSIAGGSARLTGANPSLRATGPNPALRGTGASPNLPAMPGDPALAATSPVGPDGLDGVAPQPDALAPVATSHRRGLIALISVAVVLVVGVILAVMVFVKPSDEPTNGSLGKVHDIDTSRPEDPITHRPMEPGPGSAGSGSSAQTLPHLPPPHRPNPPPPTGSNHEPEPPAGDALRSDEIEDVARKHQDMTQRCYMRSQRGADAILVGDVKKIAVTLQIDKDGAVVDVQLSDHTADVLGKCLATSIRSWKFRQSGGGRFKFSLNFVSG